MPKAQPSPPSSSTDKEFLFVPVSGPRKAPQPKRREVRKYVAKRYFRKRREQDIKNLQSSSKVTGWATRDLGPLAIRNSGSRFSSDFLRRYGEGSSSDSSSGEESPLVKLNAMRTDPFGTFPISMRVEDYQLVDFWMTDLTTSRYMYHGESYVPMRDLFAAQAVEHPASMHGLLFLAAAIASRARPGWKSNQQVLALKHRATLLELINGAIQDSNFKMPGLLQAIGFQVVHESVRGDYESCRQHLTGMRSIVLALGGPATPILANEPRVQIIFMYLSLDAQPDFLPLATRRTASLLPQPFLRREDFAYRSKTEAMEVDGYIEEFVTFLRRVDKLSALGWRLGRNSEGNPFRPGTLLYTLLAPKPDEVFANTPGVIGVHRTTRLACLLLLCHALLALNAPSQACDDYVTQQSEILLREKVDRKPDLRTFLHNLLKDPLAVRLRDLDCAYAAARCAQIAKRLSQAPHELVTRLLLSCVAMERIGNIVPLITPSDVEAIRTEAYCFQGRPIQPDDKVT